MNDSPLSPEAVAQMVADLDLFSRCGDVGVMDRDMAIDAKNMLTTLAAENAMLRAERDAALARAEKAETERDAHEASAVEAHRIKREHQSDALLWQYSAAAGNVPPLLVTIWKQRKAAENAARLAVDASQRKETELATLRAEFELLTAVKDAHKMRGDNHWETLRSIRVLAQEGKLDHIIQHVNDAGAGYTQPDHVTMWELQSALAVANDRIATLRASEAAAMEALAEIGAVVTAIEGADSLDKEIIRNIRTRIAALTPTADKEPKT